MTPEEYDIVTETRTGVRWVVTKVGERGIEVVRRGELGRVHNFLLFEDVEITR